MICSNCTDRCIMYERRPKSLEFIHLTYTYVFNLRCLISSTCESCHAIAKLGIALLAVQRQAMSEPRPPALAEACIRPARALPSPFQDHPPLHIAGASSKFQQNNAPLHSIPSPSCVRPSLASPVHMYIITPSSPRPNG